jgi:hypothetical protein
MKEPNLLEVTNIENMQLLHHLRGAGCLNTAEIYLFQFFHIFDTGFHFFPLKVT